HEPRIEDARGFAGVPDDTQRLWTPHRMAYIGGENKPEDPHDDQQCPFCAGPRRSDEDALIVHRGDSAYVILNLYPYNSGHLLVCPYRHVSDYTDLDEAEVLEVAELTRTAMRVVREVSAPAGFNLGMNQGALAGGRELPARRRAHQGDPDPAGRHPSAVRGRVALSYHDRGRTGGAAQVRARDRPDRPGERQERP